MRSHAEAVVITQAWRNGSMHERRDVMTTLMIDGVELVDDHERGEH